MYFTKFFRVIGKIHHYGNILANEPLWKFSEPSGDLRTPFCEPLVKTMIIHKVINYLHWALWQAFPDMLPVMPGKRHFCCDGTWHSLSCFFRAWRARCAPWARIGTPAVQPRSNSAANWGSSLGWCCWCSGRTVVERQAKWHMLYSWWMSDTCKRINVCQTARKWISQLSNALKILKYSQTLIPRYFLKTRKRNFPVHFHRNSYAHSIDISKYVFQNP